MDENRKMTAAISGVLQYLETEEEMAGLPSLDDAVSPPPRQNVWGLGGRQAQMQMRTMMSMKTFHRTGG